jgi:hypothetical protein
VRSQAEQAAQAIALVGSSALAYALYPNLGHVNDQQIANTYRAVCAVGLFMLGAWIFGIALSDHAAKAFLITRPAKAQPTVDTRAQTPAAVPYSPAALPMIVFIAVCAIVAIVEAVISYA